MSSFRFVPGLGLVLAFFLPFAASGQEPEGQSAPGAIQQYGVAAQFQKLEQYDLAAEEWQKLLADHPDDPLAAAARHYAGVCAFQQGDFSKAAQQFEAFLADHAAHDLADATLTNLGLAQYNLAQAASGGEAQALFQQAVTTFDRHSKQFPDSELAAQSGFYRAESLYGMGQPTDAIAAYQAWLESYAENPLAPQAQLALASTQIEAGEPSAAVETLESLLADGPDEQVATQAALELGEAHLALQQYDQAAEHFAEAAAVDGFADADYALQSQAAALFQAGAFAEAAAAYESVAEQFPESPLVAESVAAAGKSHYQGQNYSRAAELLSRAWQQAPEQVDHAHWWIRALLEAGEPQQALSAANSVLERQSSGQILLDKANALYALDDRRADSVAAYLAAAGASEGETAAEALHLAAATALELGRTDDAVEYAQRLLDEHGGTSFATDAKVTLAEAYLQSNDASRAAGLFRELAAEATGSQRHERTVRLAWALSTSGDEAAVVDTLQPIANELTGATAIQARYLLGRALLRTGEPAQAVSQLQVAVDADASGPWAAESRLMLARAHMATGDYPAAVAVLEQLVRDSSEGDLAARAYYRRGEAHQAAGDHTAAVGDFDRLAESWPDHPLAPYAAYQAAQAMSEAEQFAESAARLAQFLAQHPDHPLAADAHLVRGTSLAELDKWDEAIASLRAAVETEGEFANREQAWYELGWAYRERQQPEEARRAFERLARDWPDSPLAADALFRIGETHYDAEAFEQAARAFQTAAQHHASEAPLQEKAQHLTGWSHFKRGAHGAAAEAFAVQLSAYSNGPLAADAQWMAGEAHFAAGQYAEALSSYEAAAGGEGASDQLAPLGMLHAGQAAGQLEKWQESARWLEQAIEQYPDYSGRNELECELGWALTKLNRRDEAAELLSKVADADTSPVGARARFLLGELQFAAEEYETAVRTFFKVAYGYGDREAPEAYHAWQAEALFEAARCLEQLDRRSAARKLYAELVERFPDEPKAELAERRLGQLDD